VRSRFSAATQLLLVPLLLAGGCARYEYDIVQPPELAAHVGANSWVVLRRGNDLEYRLRTADNRLVMLIDNRGERPVKLLGADSFVVDASGESHPLYSSTIPPGTYVKRIFPPPLPTMQRNGPTVGVGVGAGYVGAMHVGHAHYPYHYPYPHHSLAYDDLEPRYYTVYDPNDRTYFDWPAEATVRFLFAFQREGEDTFRHEFLIRRRKM
jgi:hypothetical protein